MATRGAGGRALLAIASGLLAGSALAAEPKVAAPTDWQSGQQVYEKVCALCHATGVSPVLLGRELPTVYIEYVVRHGARAMPSFRSSEISDETLAKLAEYISKN